MPIVLRLIKGSELTFAELDGNFTDLDNRLDEIEAANLISRVTRLEQAGTPIYFDSDDVMVIVEAAHTCVTQRGIKDTKSSTSTACCLGQFSEHNSVLRREVISSI